MHKLAVKCSMDPPRFEACVPTAHHLGISASIQNKLQRPCQDGSREQGSWYYQPKRCTIKWGNPSNCHTFLWFHLPQAGNWMTPVKRGWIWVPQEVLRLEIWVPTLRKSTDFQLEGLLQVFSNPLISIKMGMSHKFQEPRKSPVEMVPRKETMRIYRFEGATNLTETNEDRPHPLYTWWDRVNWASKWIESGFHGI